MPDARRALLIPFAMALASCATLERDEVAAPPSGGNVAIGVGAPLVISLPPDPDAGYGWVLRSTTPNLRLVGGPDYTPQPKPPGLVGVADTTVFRFRAIETGAGAIVFGWSAPPGTSPQPDRAVRYDVTVGPMPWVPTEYLGTVGLAQVRTPGKYGNPAEPAASSGTPGTLK